MLIAVLLVEFLKRYPTTMPLAACCSASIAASCQPQEDMAQGSLTLKELQWVVVNHRTTTDGDDEVLHATFSTKEVDPLIKGRTYA
jgi:hypothetical protein